MCKIQRMVLEIRSEAMNNECKLVFIYFSAKAVLVLKVICVKRQDNGQSGSGNEDLPLPSISLPATFCKDSTWLCTDYTQQAMMHNPSGKRRRVYTPYALGNASVCSGRRTDVN